MANHQYVLRAILYKTRPRYPTSSSCWFVLMSLGYDIKKWYWGRYEIVQPKSNQYHHYGMSRVGEYEIGIDKSGKYGPGKYGYPSFLEKVASISI